VTDIDAEVSQATLDTASELLWTISQQYKRVGLELDAFQIPYKIDVPQKKLFMA
jgi:phenylalanine-4-hydroxylase